MLEHWIEPPKGPVFPDSQLDSDRIGSQLSTLSEASGQQSQRSVALIGADSRWTKYVRRHLYRFTHRMGDIQIYDLGNLRRNDPDFVTGPLLELMSTGVCPIVIGGHLTLLKSLKQSSAYHKEDFRPLILHESVPETILNLEDRATIVGVQQHLIPRSIPDRLKTLHLSYARYALEDADTLIRETNCTVFDLSAMSSLDLPAQRSTSTSGFDTGEACTLMRSVGLHGQTRAILISGHDPMSLQLDQCANVVAQMIWYFLEAYNQCIIEHPLSSSHCTPYAVHIDDYEMDLKFYKSERTGRWWIGFAGSDEVVFPCTYRDYERAVNGIVSERILSCAGESLEGVEQ